MFVCTFILICWSIGNYSWSCSLPHCEIVSNSFHDKVSRPQITHPSVFLILRSNLCPTILCANILNKTRHSVADDTVWVIDYEEDTKSPFWLHRSRTRVIIRPTLLVSLNVHKVLQETEGGLTKGLMNLCVHYVLDRHMIVAKNKR